MGSRMKIETRRTKFVRPENLSVSNEDALTAFAVHTATAMDIIAKMRNDPHFNLETPLDKPTAQLVESYRMSPALIRANLRLASSLPKVLKKASPRTRRSTIYNFTTPLADFSAMSAHTLNDIRAILDQRIPRDLNNLRKSLIKLEIDLQGTIRAQLDSIRRPCRTILRDLAKNERKRRTKQHRTGGRRRGRARKK